jgi:hypothetical protein
MRALTSSANLESFMLRLDRAAPARRWSGGFDLALAAATLEAHLDFISGLDLSAACPVIQSQLRSDIRGFHNEVRRFRSGLIRLWLSGTLSLSSKMIQERLECMQAIYAHALGHGHALMSRAIPCSVSWYDATVGR